MKNSIETAVGGGGKSNWRIQEVQVNEKENDRQVSKGGQVNKRVWRQGRIKH